MRRQGLVIMALAALPALALSPGAAPPSCWGEDVVLMARRIEYSPVVKVNPPPSTASRPSTGPEIVRTLAGDVLNGRVVGIGTDGTLRLTGLQFGGEVTVASSALDRVTLQCTPSERGPDIVRTTNGDRIAGSVVGVSPESVDVQSGLAGLLKIPRKMVTAISFGGRQDLLVESYFPAGHMEPWKPHTGSWTVGSGMLLCHSSSGQNHAVHAKLEQTEAVTIVAHCKSPGKSLPCWLVLFADDTSGGLGRNGLYAGLSGSSWYIGYRRNGSGTNLVSRSLGRSVPEGTIRFAYDPKTGMASLWLDSALLGEQKVPHKPQRGQYVMLMSQYPSQTRYIRVLRGIVPPPETEESEGSPEGQTDVVQFKNGDRLTARDVSMTDGRLVILTPWGKLTPEPGRVGHIAFRRKGLETPRRRKGDVYLLTAGRRLTVQLKELKGEHLLGTPSCGGEVKIDRKAIRSIRFNIYRQPPAVGAKTGATHVPAPGPVRHGGIAFEIR